MLTKLLVGDSDAWRSPHTLGGLLSCWARAQPQHRAFVFLGSDNRELESFTFGSLDRAARRLAATLSQHARIGDRVLLMFPSGLAFVLGFFACQYAGMIPVPVTPPRNRRLREATFPIAQDCAPAIGLLPKELHDSVAHQFAKAAKLPPIRLIPVDIEDFDRANAATFEPIQQDGDAIAFLQYTSGSVSAPKGVQVSQANIMANLDMQRLAFQNEMHETYVGWAPLYHDMGLIANVLEPVYLGGLCVLMSPGQFAQYPWLWLRAISDYRAQVSGGPNFAYELCISRSKRVRSEHIELSCWRVAFNSAEPVQAATMHRFSETFASTGFRPEAMYPCYGLAEATLLVSGRRPRTPYCVTPISKTALAAGLVRAPMDASDAQLAVGCGQALEGEALAIVDPKTFERLPDGTVGEVWVGGPHIPAGYWGNTSASKETFYAHLKQPTDEQRYLRTADLGFLREGQLYITGRLKDLLIVRGRNIYPQDVERIAERAFPGLKPNAGAAIGLFDEAAQMEQIVLVQEVERATRKTLDIRAATAAIRLAIMQEFDLTLRAVVFIAPGSIPRTSSGKIRRSETRLRFLAGTLERIQARSTDTTAPLPAENLMLGPRARAAE
ncbi:MAG: fatty acyl-AMP ligase [Burkholderiales bacterium]